jgi:hypothetical protein
MIALPLSQFRACACIMIGAGVFLLTAAAHAEPPSAWMTDAQIRALLVGHQVTGIYPSGERWTETTKADGTTALTEDGGPSTGHWTLGSTGESSGGSSGAGQLCFKYVETGGGCFRYRVVGPNCYEHFFQMTAADQAEWLPDRPVITNGRLWRTDQPKACEPHFGS